MAQAIESGRRFALLCIDCTSEGVQQAQRFDRVIKESQKTLVAGPTPSTAAGTNRKESMLQILTTVREAWWAQYQRFQGACKDGLQDR